MNPSKTIKYKALFLLISFSLNSVVGFACSLGVGMGFNSDHHSHGSGEQHENSDADHHQQHDGNNSHSHEHKAKSHHHSNTDNNTVCFASQNEDNCCKDFVVGFQSMDKLLAKQNNTQQKISGIPPFIAIFIIEVNNTKGFATLRSVPPREVDYSPPDICVFIQSFLI